MGEPVPVVLVDQLLALLRCHRDQLVVGADEMQLLDCLLDQPVLEEHPDCRSANVLLDGLEV